MSVKAMNNRNIKNYRSKFDRSKFAYSLQKGILVFPAFILLLVFVVIPIISTLVYGFTDWDGYSKQFNFVGLENYISIFKDKYALIAIKNTWYFAIVSLVISNILGLITALILDSDIRGRNIARTIIFIPSIICSIIGGFIWSYIYEPNNGFLNTALRLVGLEMLERNWLGDPSIVVFSIVVVHIWLTTGIKMVIYLAGLQTIPVDLIESSYIEGTNSIQRFRYIIWPLLAHALTINVMIALIWGLQEFSLVYVMTGGGPAFMSNTIVTYVYQIGFKSGNYGLGSAFLLIMIIMIFLVSSLVMNVLKKREVEL